MKRRGECWVENLRLLPTTKNLAFKIIVINNSKKQRTKSGGGTEICRLSRWLVSPRLLSKMARMEGQKECKRIHFYTTQRCFFFSLSWFGGFRWDLVCCREATYVGILLRKEGGGTFFSNCKSVCFGRWITLSIFFFLAKIIESMYVRKKWLFCWCGLPKGKGG